MRYFKLVQGRSYTHGDKDGSRRRFAKGPVYKVGVETGYTVGVANDLARRPEFQETDFDGNPLGGKPLDTSAPPPGSKSFRSMRKPSVLPSGIPPEVAAAILDPSAAPMQTTVSEKDVPAEVKSKKKTKKSKAKQKPVEPKVEEVKESAPAVTEKAEEVEVSLVKEDEIPGKLPTE